MITFIIPWPENDPGLNTIITMQNWLGERLGWDQTPATWEMRMGYNGIIVRMAGHPELATLFKLRFST